VTIVVSDTSPIRALANLRLPTLLQKLYSDVIIPQAVQNELKNPPTWQTAIARGGTEVSASRQRRRWLSLSLRSMLIAIVAAGLWLGWWVNSSRNQQAAVAAVETAPYFANVIYDDDPDYYPADTPVARRLMRKMKSWVPTSIRARLGKDYFENALSIAFSTRDDTGAGDREVFRRVALVRSLDQLVPNVEVVDADLAHIARLPYLRLLSLPADSPLLTEASLLSLAGAPRLETLEIYNAPVTDAWLAHLEGMRRLSSLMLGYVTAHSDNGNMIAVTGEGLRHLTRLSSLTELAIHSSALTSNGLERLGKLRQLKRLKLKGRSITDDDLRFLAPLANLEQLEIAGSSINGTGFRHLAGLSRVTNFSVESSNITDAAIPFLAQLPALRSVSVYGTRVTASGLEGFRAAPRLKYMALIPAVTGDTKRLKRSLPGCNVLNGGTGL
jgi:hypothetical protein